MPYVLSKERIREVLRDAQESGDSPAESLSPVVDDADVDALIDAVSIDDTQELDRDLIRQVYGTAIATIKLCKLQAEHARTTGNTLALQQNEGAARLSARHVLEMRAHYPWLDQEKG